MEFCHGGISDEELEAYLFRPMSIFPHRRGLKLYGESDQKLAYLIPVLARLGYTCPIRLVNSRWKECRFINVRARLV